MPDIRCDSWVSLFAALLLLLGISAGSGASDSWYPLRERTLEVEPGSALDFSTMFAVAPAGSLGWVQIDGAGRLRFADDVSPRRFQCASLVPSPPNGGLPDKAEADRWVAQMQRAGYNLVRLHYIDASLMTQRKGDFDFDPVALDRLHYLMAGLKAAGIYWVVDGLTSENGAYGNVQPHRWKNLHDLKRRLYYDPAALAHWKRLVTTLWGTVNPYTGIAPLNDPAMLGMVLVNEGGLAFVSTLAGRYADELKVPFANWLARRYASEAAWRKAWDGEPSGADRFAAAVSVPREVRGSDRRSTDFAAFIADRELELYREMAAHVRARGFRGLVTSYNNWDFNPAHAVRSHLQWVDMHAYQSLPSRYVSPGSRMPQVSLFDDAGRYGRVLASSRQWGKPFTVTEYGQPFWNQWRFESAGWLPALAAFQGWDAVCQFAELPVLLDYEDKRIERRQALYPFGVGADPVARGAERLATVLFRRGDVATSRARVMLEANSSILFSNGKIWGPVPERLSRAALVAAIGRGDAGQPAQRPPDLRISLDSGESGWVDRLNNFALKKGMALGDDPVDLLKATGSLAETNRSNIGRGVFVSDTGQMRFDTPSRTIVVASPRTVVLTLRAGGLSGGAMEVSRLSGPATVAVSSLDGAAIDQSKRLLLWVLTDAENTGMSFADNERTSLKTLGRFPVRIRQVRGDVAIQHTAASGLKVWALDQSGRRVAEVAAKVGRAGLRFALNNVVTGYGPVTYFEVAAR